MPQNIQNPGSALGEAIGATMETALNVFLDELAESVGHHFISKGLSFSKSGSEKKLLMYDKFGTAYNIDSVIANPSMQPIILIESKYIRYKKHNRDKGSWVCTAHPALRRRYASIRSSIAVLAGNWSSSSLAMMRSFDINIFLIPFERICDLLEKHDIDFDWGEKDRTKAIRAWKKFDRLKPSQKATIGKNMVALVEKELKKTVLSILDDSIEREISKISLELHSNIGEVKAYEFKSIDEVVEFLNSEELKEVFITTDSITLFDPPPVFPDDERTPN